MKRLTRKVQLCRHLITGREIKYNSIKDDSECIDKLGTLEDIEEELDIDLIKAIELCKQVNSKKVVYTKERWGIDTIKIIDELDVELFSHRLYSNSRGIYVSLDLKEYGKEWSLDKSDLVNDIVKKEWLEID